MNIGIRVIPSGRSRAPPQHRTNFGLQVVSRPNGGFHDAFRNRLREQLARLFLAPDLHSLCQFQKLISGQLVGRNH